MTPTWKYYLQLCFDLLILSAVCNSQEANGITKLAGSPTKMCMNCGGKEYRNVRLLAIEI